MKNLIFAELNKIICKKSTYIVLIISFVFVFLGVYFFELLSLNFTDLDGTIYKGISVPKISKQVFQKCQEKNILPKRLTNEEIKQSIDNLKELNEEQLKMSSIRRYLYFLNSNYQLSDTADPSLLFSLSEEKISDFYKARQIKIQNELNDPRNNYSPEEKSFWIEKAQQSNERYDYEYYAGWMEFLDKAGFFIFIILAICVAVAPVYSYEYQSGMDSIILASKYGKSRVNIAKIFASLLFAFIIITVSVLSCLGVTLAIFGTSGWNAPVQISYPFIAYPYNFFKLTLVTIGIIYIVTFGMVILTLLFSSCMKTPFSVLIVDVALIFVPMFLGDNNKIINLLPVKLINPIWYSYISYTVFGRVIDIYSMAILCYLLLIVLLVPVTINIFKKHQVS